MIDNKCILPVITDKLNIISMNTLSLYVPPILLSAPTDGLQLTILHIRGNLGRTLMGVLEN